MQTHMHTHTYTHTSSLFQLYHIYLKDSKHGINSHMDFHKWPSGNKISLEMTCKILLKCALAHFFPLKLGFAVLITNSKGLWSKNPKTMPRQLLQFWVQITIVLQHFAGGNQILFISVCQPLLRAKCSKGIWWMINCLFRRALSGCWKLWSQYYTRRNDIHETEKSILAQLLWSKALLVQFTIC